MAKPPFSTLPAMGLPMFPTPMKPTDTAMLVLPALELLAARTFLGDRRLHLPERRVLGGDHVQYHGFLGLHHAVQLADQLLDRLHADARAAHGLGDLRVVLAAQLRGDEAVPAPPLAVLHPAQDAVVEDDG